MSQLREFAAFRELPWALTLREIKVRYNQTLLDLAWVIVQPLALMVVFSIFFGRLARVPSDGLPIPLFSYSALLPRTLVGRPPDLDMLLLASASAFVLIAGGYLYFKRAERHFSDAI